MTLYDTIITHDPRIKLTGDFATTFNLHISNIQKEDRGVYMCQINTDPMIYQRAQLDVNIPPDIDGARTSGTKNHIFKGKKGEKKRENHKKKIFLGDVEAKLGASVKIKCNADGYPTPTIKWMREDGNLIKIKDSSTGRTLKLEKFIGPTLVIHNVDTEDMGSYLCIADNGVPPIVSKRIFVYVQCKI